MDKNGKKMDVYIDDTLLKELNYVELWTDASIEFISSVKGVAFVKKLPSRTSCYVVRFDPRYDVGFVIKELVAGIKIGES